MTSQEMIDRFSLLSQMYKSPFWEPEDIYGFINMAISLFLDAHFPQSEKATGTNGASQFITDNLYTLVKSSYPVPSDVNVADYSLYATCFIPLPADYYNYQSMVVKWNSGNKKTPITIVSWDEFNKLDADPFAEADYDNNVFGVFHSKLLLKAPAIPDVVQLVYIQNPAIVSELVDCNLPPRIHSKIVQLAYSVSLLTIDDLEKFKVNLSLF